MWLLELGRMFTLARVTWQEIPSPEQLVAAQLLLKQTDVKHTQQSPIFKVHIPHVNMTQAI